MRCPILFYFFSVGLSVMLLGVIAREKEVHGVPNWLMMFLTELTDSLFLPCHFNLALTI